MLFGLLGGSCFSLGFLPHGTDSKMGINIQPPEHMDCSCESYAKTYVVFFHGLFHNSHANVSLLFFAILLFQSFLSLGKLFSFFLQIHDPPRVAKKISLHAGGGFVAITLKRVYCKLCLLWAYYMLSFYQIPIAQYYRWACTHVVLVFLGLFHRF